MIARNQLGEAYATTNLKLRKRRDDFRGVLGKKESKFFNRREKYPYDEAFQDEAATTGVFTDNGYDRDGIYDGNTAYDRNTVCDRSTVYDVPIVADYRLFLVITAHVIFL